MLTIEHLTKQFGEKTLFRDLCLTVEGPAVLWAPSGWGKTTLLRILMGLEEPTSGIVQGVGRVAAVFQEDRLCSQLTAVQNVTLVLPGSAEQYKEQIIKDFQQFGMDAAALALPAARLSGGQKRRTALLRAFVGRQRYAAVRRTLYRHGPGHPCRCCGSAAGALRRKACLAGYPRPRSHPPSGWPVVELENA